MPVQDERDGQRCGLSGAVGQAGHDFLVDTVGAVWLQRQGQDEATK